MMKIIGIVSSGEEAQQVEFVAAVAEMNKRTRDLVFKLKDSS